MAKHQQSLSNVQKTRTLISKEVSKLQSDLERTQRNLDNKLSQLDSVQKEVTRLENNELDVSDHAIVRYMERIMGIDTQMIRDAILTESVRQMHLKLGDGKYPAAVENDDHCTVVIRSGVVITLYGRDD